MYCQQQKSDNLSSKCCPHNALDRIHSWIETRGEQVHNTDSTFYQFSDTNHECKCLKTNTMRARHRQCYEHRLPRSLVPCNGRQRCFLGLTRAKSGRFHRTASPSQAEGHGCRRKGTSLLGHGNALDYTLLQCRGCISEENKIQKVFPFHLKFEMVM